VDRLGGVDVVDHRGQGGGLARTGRPGHQQQPTGEFGQRPKRRRKVQLGERRAPQPDPPKDEGDRTALTVCVHPEPSDAGHGVGEVGLVRALEAFAAIGGHDDVGHAGRVAGQQDGALDPAQLPVHPDARLGAYHQVEVRAVRLVEQLQHGGQIDHRLPSGC